MTLKYYILYAILLILAVIRVGGIEIQPGKCQQNRNEAVIQNFDVGKFLGRWYEVMRYDNFFQTSDTECGMAQYFSNPNGTVKVDNYAIKGDGTRINQVGYAVLAFPDEDPIRGLLNVTFAGAPSRINYRILDTDYSNYLVMFNCVQASPLLKVEYFWVMSRKPQFYPEVPVAVDDIIDKYFERERIHVTKQGEFCFASR